MRSLLGGVGLILTALYAGAAFAGGVGSACGRDDDCDGKLICTNGLCEPPQRPPEYVPAGGAVNPSQYGPPQSPQPAYQPYAPAQNYPPQPPQPQPAFQPTQAGPAYPNAPPPPASPEAMLPAPYPSQAGPAQPYPPTQPGPNPYAGWPTPPQSLDDRALASYPDIDKVPPPLKDRYWELKSQKNLLQLSLLPIVVGLALGGIDLRLDIEHAFSRLAGIVIDPELAVVYTPAGVATVIGSGIGPRFHFLETAPGGFFGELQLVLGIASVADLSVPVAGIQPAIGYTFLIGSASLMLRGGIEVSTFSVSPALDLALGVAF